MTDGKSMAQRVAEARECIPEIDVEALAARQSDGSCLHIDVREPDEWARGRIPGVVLVPLGSITSDIAAKVFEGAITPDHLDQPIVVSCRSGQRSLVGADTLRQMGFRDVVSLAGGIIAWQVAGRPIES